MLGAGEARGRLGELQHELRTLCTALDPDAVALPELSGLWSSLDSIERLASGAKCRLSRRMAESRSWQRRGARSPEEDLARRSGTTTGRARAALATSKALTDLPETDAALARGELSEQQASAIAGAAGADPSAEGQLLALARRGRLGPLREECARVRARAEDEQARAQRLHRQRSLRTWTGPDGAWNLSVRNTPEMGAAFEAALAPLREAVFAAARQAGEHESGEAYGADALAEMVRCSAAAGGEQPGVPGEPPTAETDPASTGPNHGVGGPGSAQTTSPGPADSPDPDARAAGEPATERPDADRPGSADGGPAPDDTDDTNHHHDDDDRFPGGAVTDAGPASAPTAHEPAGHADHRRPGSTAGSPATDTDGSGPDSGPDQVGRASGPDPGGGRRASRSRRPDTKVIVLIDYEALRRGWAEAGETCEIAGVGPVPVATARSLMSDAFGAAIVTNGVDTFTVAHLGRSVTAHQRSALEARGYRCEVPGCGARRALEIDHVEEWSRTFRTSLDSLAWLCRVHHRHKTYGGWRLLGPPGHRRWVPRADPSPPQAGGPDPPAPIPAERLAS